MLSLVSPSEAQKKLSEHVRAQRLELQLTQHGLALRSGVALPTLRKFEQQGLISLEGFLKLQMVLGGLVNKEIVSLLNKTEPRPFRSIDDVLKDDSKPVRKRGNRT